MKTLFVTTLAVLKFLEKPILAIGSAAILMDQIKADLLQDITFEDIEEVHFYTFIFTIFILLIPLNYTVDARISPKNNERDNRGIQEEGKRGWEFGGH